MAGGRTALTGSAPLAAVTVAFSALLSLTGYGRGLWWGDLDFLRMEYRARFLKKSLGISCSLGLDGVGMTMPKSSALPSNLGCTVNVSCFFCGSQVRNAFCAGCRMSASLAEK